MDRPISLRPDRTATREAAAASITRACASQLIAKVEALNASGRSTPDQVARAAWPDDRNVLTVNKAAVAPAALSAPAWAGLWGQTSIADVVSLLVPSSAGAQLLAKCMSLEWNGYAQLNVPTLAVNAGAVTWVGEGLPIPVWDYVSSFVSVTPKKVGSITIYSREMATTSTPNFEKLVRAAIGESLSVALDGTLFSASAGDAATPSGLFFGITPTTPSVSTIPSEAMAEDLAKIISKVAAVSGDSEIVLVMSPAQAAAVRVRTDVDYASFSSSVMPSGSVAAFATNAICSVGDSAPEITARMEASVHEETVPQALGSVGPTKSLFQTDCLSLRLYFSMNWAVRSPLGVAWAQNVSW
jgi:hypothetical protein